MEGRSKREASRDRKAAEPAAVPQLTGHTMTDHITVFDAPTRLIGHTVTLDIDDASGFTLFGKVRTDETIGLTSNPLSSMVLKPRRVTLNIV